MSEIKNLFVTSASAGQVTHVLCDLATASQVVRLSDDITVNGVWESNITCANKIVGMVKIAPARYFTDGYNSDDFSPEVSDTHQLEFIEEVHQFDYGISFCFFESEVPAFAKALSRFVQEVAREVDASMVEQDFAIIRSQNTMDAGDFYTVVTGHWAFRQKVKLGSMLIVGCALLPLLLVKKLCTSASKLLSNDS